MFPSRRSCSRSTWPSYSKKTARPLGSHNYFPGDERYKDVVTDTDQGSGDTGKAKQISGITKQTAYKRLPVVKGNRVRTLGGTTWLFGGPRSTMLFADRLTAALK